MAYALMVYDFKARLLSCALCGAALEDGSETAILCRMLQPGWLLELGGLTLLDHCKCTDCPFISRPNSRFGTDL